MAYAALQTSGFLFTQTGLPVALMKADFGDGYAAPAAVISSPHGLRGWSVRIGAMAQADGLAEYLFQFFLTQKRASDVPFWIQDPKDDLFYLAAFVDDQLSYDILCGAVFSTGLQLQQRRVRDQESPVGSLPGGPPSDWPEWGQTDFGG